MVVRGKAGKRKGRAGRENPAPGKQAYACPTRRARSVCVSELASFTQIESGWGLLLKRKRVMSLCNEALVPGLAFAQADEQGVDQACGKGGQQQARAHGRRCCRVAGIADLQHEN